jgi:hypothetical protein
MGAMCEQFKHVGNAVGRGAEQFGQTRGFNSEENSRRGRFRDDRWVVGDERIICRRERTSMTEVSVDQKGRVAETGVAEEVLRG